MKARIKVGDTVKIGTDYSYSRAVIKGVLQDIWWSLSKTERDARTYTVIATDCSFPIVEDWQERGADTVIQDKGSYMVVFIHASLLMLAQRTIKIDNKTIELSEESYQNLRAQLCPKK